MFWKSVEVSDLLAKNDALLTKNEQLTKLVDWHKEQLEAEKLKTRDLQWDIKTMARDFELKTEEKINELRKNMQESLIKSDLLRTEALAKLEIYEKTDTKADANTIKEMVGQLIGAIGKQGINVIK